MIGMFSNSCIPWWIPWWWDRRWGQGAGSTGAADWLNWMILGTIQGFTQGFSIKCPTNSVQRGLPEAAQDGGQFHPAGNSYLTGAACLASEFLARPVLELLQTPDTIIDDSL